jgi:hypothetical protein
MEAVMKFRIIAALAALLMSGAALAGSSQINLAELAERANLRERDVRMVLGAPVAFAEYRTSYARAYYKLKNAVGGKRQLEMLAQRYREQQRQAEKAETSSP